MTRTTRLRVTLSEVEPRATPAWLWPGRNWSRADWTIAAVWLNLISAHAIWHVGAVIALGQANKNRKKNVSVPPALPFATGQADSNWWNVDTAPAPKPAVPSGWVECGGLCCADGPRPPRRDDEPEDVEAADDWTDADHHTAVSTESLDRRRRAAVARPVGDVVPIRSPDAHDGVG